MGMSGSFGSSLFNVEEGDESVALSFGTRKRFKPPPDTEGEHSPLNGSTSTLGESPTINPTLLTTILVVTIGSSLQFGYATGVMNNSEQIIMDYFHDQEKEYDILQWGTTVSCYGLGGLIGSVIGPKVIGEFCGRRATLLINNIFLLISSYLMGFAPVWWWQAVGRVFVGIVAGVATAVVPSYFAEISPIEVRGAVGTMHQLGITVGILISQALSTPSLNLLGSKQNWRWLFLVPVVCGFIEMAVLPFCPESPSYLYVTKGERDAREALVRLQSEAVADKYLGYIQEEIKASLTGGGAMGVLELFRDKTLRKQLIVGVTVQLMMQFSGIDAVFYYSTRVFYQADVQDPELATTCLGVINVIITIFAVKWMDTAGRKTLLTYSWIGMCASYVILTLSFVLKPYSGYMDQVRTHCDFGSSFARPAIHHQRT
jgi:sugar porter (SP) family MFS transporter